MNWPTCLLAIVTRTGASILTVRNGALPAATSGSPVSHEPTVCPSMNVG
jgi:hypothetical protein